MAEGTTTKRYEVTEVTGVVQTFDADWMFNNSGEITFRLGERGKSDVVAMFAPGQWVSVVNKSANSEEVTQ